MRGIFGLVGLVVALAVIGITLKKQLGATPQVTAPAGATVRDNAQQVQQQYKQAVEAAMQPRSDPDAQ